MLTRTLLGREAYPAMEEDDGAQGGAALQDAPEDKAQAAGEKKTFTQEELDAILGKEYAKWQKEAEGKAAAARQEGEALARLSLKEREEREREAREAELQKREADISRRELRAQALEALAEKGMPTELADVLDYADEERVKASLGAVEKAFRAALDRSVSQRLKGSPPKAGEAAAGDAAISAIFGVAR